MVYRRQRARSLFCEKMESDLQEVAKIRSDDKDVNPVKKKTNSTTIGIIYSMAKCVAKDVPALNDILEED